jgi:large subunit ribosomal protein L21
MYALVEILGKQYKAEKGKELVVDFYDRAKKGETLQFPVLLLSDGKQTKVGAPHVSGSQVTVKVGESFRDKKVTIFKYQKRKAYRKTIGHRQSYTKVMVQDIVG